MNFFTTKRLVATAFVLLALLNVTLLGMLWWQSTNGPILRRGHHDRHLFFSRQLALNESQTASFDQLRKEHFLKVEAEMQAVGMLKKQLIEESLQESPDTKKIETIALNIGSRQSAIEQKMALYFHELYRVCTPQQRDSLKIVLERVATHRHHNNREQ
jgi:Spy/CpxP family protein refolding chaperone